MFVPELVVNTTLPLCTAGTDWPLLYNSPVGDPVGLVYVELQKIAGTLPGAV